MAAAVIYPVAVEGFPPYVIAHNQNPNNTPGTSVSTHILPVAARRMGWHVDADEDKTDLNYFRITAPQPITHDFLNLQIAARALQTSDTPVAFPTETVYGLGADATRSAAVQGIYKAKQRPSDNPLIVHIATLRQLRRLLTPGDSDPLGDAGGAADPIPAIYLPLIKRYWPGPLTILLPVPTPSPFAAEVTAGLDTVGVRMPRSPIALGLIALADRPLAAPSANASGKPSPTSAQHVLQDLIGRIEYIVDGGPMICDVGVESTVVDGLSSPPAVLRPGSIGLESIRAVPGWEQCVIGYKDLDERKDSGVIAESVPRAPGMKYRHYAPNARVLLYEVEQEMPPPFIIYAHQSECGGRFGVIRTAKWPRGLGMKPSVRGRAELAFEQVVKLQPSRLPEVQGPRFEVWKMPLLTLDMTEMVMIDVGLGGDAAGIARELFSALRAVDEYGPSVIFVEGIDDQAGPEAAAVMNRLRKAASG